MTILILSFFSPNIEYRIVMEKARGEDFYGGYLEAEERFLVGEDNISSLNVSYT